MNHFNSDPKLGLFFHLLGDYVSVEHLFARDLRYLEGIPENCNLIVGYNDAIWEQTPLLRTLSSRFRNSKVYKIHTEEELPAEMFSKLLKSEHTGYDYYLFGQPGCNLLAVDISKVIDSIKTSDNEETEVKYLGNTLEKPYEKQFLIKANQLGILQSIEPLPLYHYIFSRFHVDNYPLFTQEKLLQKHSYWPVLIRIAKSHNFKYIGKKSIEANINFKLFPFKRHYLAPLDLVHRYVIREGYTEGDKASFQRDIYPSEIVPKLKSPHPLRDKPLSISILGGYWEHTHNQLCFFNYLDDLVGRGFGSYRVLNDAEVDILDFESSDLVILSRSRADFLRELIPYCKKRKIKTLYMIDDNWFTAATDWPSDYGNIFVEGNPNFENFLYALSNCDGVLLYSKILREYVLKYSKNVYLIPTNIKPSLFLSSHQPIHTRTKLVIGYTGSLRYDDTAFKALAEISNNNNNLNVLLWGRIKPSQLALFKNRSNVSLYENVNYIKYAKNVRSMHPDILLAPLEDSVTSRSKCPNKYLEITMSGAVGIYSNVEPYSSVIENNKTGILTENTPQAWYQSIALLIDNLDLRNSIYENAHKQVIDDYSTDRIMPEFVRTIEELVKQN